MTEPSLSPGLWIPFANPIEIFAVSAEGAIDFTGSYKAVCRQLTAEDMIVLQVEAEAPARMVIGVHCEGHVFFLPGRRVDFQPLGASVFSLQAHFTTTFNPQGPPPKIEFVSEDEIADWVRDLQRRQQPDEERRKHERSVYNEPIHLSGAPADHPVFAMNLSEGGIALLTTFPLTAQAVRHLDLPLTDGTTVRRRMRVVHCTPILPPFYTVGGQFLAN